MNEAQLKTRVFHYPKISERGFLLQGEGHRASATPPPHPDARTIVQIMNQWRQADGLLRTKRSSGECSCAVYPSFAAPPSNKIRPSAFETHRSRLGRIIEALSKEKRMYHAF